MILSGIEIKRQIHQSRIGITDFCESRLNPNSYNLRLGVNYMTYINDVFDVKERPLVVKSEIPSSGLRLLPGELYLAPTFEHTYTPFHVPMIEGRSSLGRLGLFVHITAGFGDVGFNGFWTLEITCLKPIIIYPMMEICQIYFHTLEGDFVPYVSNKYQNNEGVQESMIYKEFQNGV